VSVSLRAITQPALRCEDIAARTVWGCQPKAFWICAIVAPDLRLNSLRNCAWRVGFLVTGFDLLVCCGVGLDTVIGLSTLRAKASPSPCTEWSPERPGDILHITWSVPLRHAQKSSGYCGLGPEDTPVTAADTVEELSAIDDEIVA
jgi:hypothetical protein